MQESDNHKYEDILFLQRPMTKRRGKMSLQDRAAQFSPFAALTGYDAVIEETARLTEAYTELDEGGMELLNQKLQRIMESEARDQPVTFLIYVPDERKAGGHYVPVTGVIKRIEAYNQRILLQDGRQIQIGSIRQIEGADE